MIKLKSYNTNIRVRPKLNQSLISQYTYSIFFVNKLFHIFNLTLNIHLYILLDMDTTILIKTKKDLKLQAQVLAAEFGFSLTDIINASLRQFVINQGITISKTPTETLDIYTNKKEIISAYEQSLKEF